MFQVLGDRAVHWHWLLPAVTGRGGGVGLGLNRHPDSEGRARRGGHLRHCRVKFRSHSDPQYYWLEQAYSSSYSAIPGRKPPPPKLGTIRLTQNRGQCIFPGKPQCQPSGVWEWRFVVVWQCHCRGAVRSCLANGLIVICGKAVPLAPAYLNHCALWNQAAFCYKWAQGSLDRLHQHVLYGRAFSPP